MVGAARRDSFGEITPAPPSAAPESIIDRLAEVSRRNILE
jgi:hypothetical protein